MTNQLGATDYLKFADLQMAAEATLAPGMDQAVMVAALVKGNGHASKFVEFRAVEFETAWEVLEQRETSTGFSGTLFKHKTTHEIVMSFRSTEFIDDAARDNQATNAMEIAEFREILGSDSN